MRSISTLRPAAQASSSRQFSTAPVVLAKRQELVELLVEHPRLGTKGDRVFVQPGYARHRLIPFRVARLVPHWRWFGIKPFKNTEAMTDALQIEGPRSSSSNQQKPASSSRRSFSTTAFASSMARRSLSTSTTMARR